jgi:hypothetical protein
MEQPTEQKTEQKAKQATARVIDPETIKLLLRFERDELTGSLLYERIARRARRTRTTDAPFWRFPARNAATMSFGRATPAGMCGRTGGRCSSSSP